MIVKALRRAAVACLAIISSGCGGGSATPQPAASGASTGSSALVRFVNANPDAGYPDPAAPGFLRALGPANVVANGTVLATVQAGLASTNGTTVPAASASGYVPVPASITAVSFQSVTVSSGGTVGPYPISVQAGKRYTAVLGGSTCANSVRLYVFADSAPATAATLTVYHVAPDLAPVYTFGAFPASAGAPLTQLGTVSAGKSAGAAIPSGIAQNVGAYVGDAAGASIATLLPSATYAIDAANAIPFHALTTFSLFVADSAIQGTGSGDFSCNSETQINPGVPTVVGVLNQ